MALTSNAHFLQVKQYIFCGYKLDVQSFMRKNLTAVLWFSKLQRADFLLPAVFSHLLDASANNETFRLQQTLLQTF